MPSFDAVPEVDKHELTNAYEQAERSKSDKPHKLFVRSFVNAIEAIEQVDAHFNEAENPES